MFAKLYSYFAEAPATDIVPPSKQLLDCAASGNVDHLRTLLQSGVDLNTVNESGNKAVHIAAYEGHVPVLRLLLDSGANVNDLGRGNNTPLHFAARNNHLDAVSFLMSRGADATAQNWRGLEASQVTDNKEVGRIIFEATRSRTPMPTGPTTSLPPTTTVVHTSSDDVGEDSGRETNYEAAVVPGRAVRLFTPPQPQPTPVPVSTVGHESVDDSCAVVTTVTAGNNDSSNETVTQQTASEPEPTVPVTPVVVQTDAPVTTTHEPVVVTSNSDETSVQPEGQLPSSQ